MGPAKRTDGAVLESVTRTPGGEICAVTARSRADNVVARFDTTSFTWPPLAPTPNPFSPRPASTDISNLWPSDRHLLISTSSTYIVPRLFYPFGYDNARIQGNAVLFGRSGPALDASEGSRQSDERMWPPVENWHSTAPVHAYQLGMRCTGRKRWTNREIVSLTSATMLIRSGSPVSSGI
jgi:hypothetical protein